VRRFIRRRVVDDHTADDLLQEVFLRIHRNLAGLGDGDRLAAWVYRIARNVVHDHHRRGPGGEAPLVDDPPSAEDRTGDILCRAGEWLDELIRQLPEGYAEAVRHSEIDGHTQQEVADRLGLSLSGAKSRIQRGRAMLKDMLDGCCRFHFDRRGNLTDCDPKPGRSVCLDCDEPI
jgi:RNA polymerase sigma-70 factor (ECF subfamily)